jgi:2'-5' RNA ligase
MIVQKLSDQGFEPDSKHGFQPHITLSYIPKLSPSPIQVLPEPISVRFDQITIAWADEQTSFPLGDRIAVSYPWSEDNALQDQP